MINNSLYYEGRIVKKSALIHSQPRLQRNFLQESHIGSVKYTTPAKVNIQVLDKIFVWKTSGEEPKLWRQIAFSSELSSRYKISLHWSLHVVAGSIPSVKVLANSSCQAHTISPSNSSALRLVDGQMPYLQTANHATHQQIQGNERLDWTVIQKLHS